MSVSADRPERCEGRYPVPETSPPRDEPFDVTYRCALPKGHDGAHGEIDDRLDERNQEVLDAVCSAIEERAADRPVENSELREAVWCLAIEVYLLPLLISRIELIVAEKEAQSDLDHQKLCELSVTICELRAEISRLRQERKEIAQEFGVSTDFDLGEHARVVMASQDDFKAELARLRAIGEVR